jgi:uncharacterized membrane protein YdjX (TVP38/TMEM64 family)
VTRLLRLAWKPALMLVGLAAAALLLRQTGFDPRAAMDDAGRQGPAWFVLLGTVACALAVPRQLVALAAGYAFGVWPGVVLALLAEGAGCAIDFWWARLLGRRAAAGFLRRREGGRLDRLNRFLSARAFTATLTLRLLPLGSNVVLNLLAGVSGVAFAPFLLGSVLGYVPQTVVFSLAGSGASVSDGTQLALSAALLLASVALGVVLLRRGPRPAATP